MYTKQKNSSLNDNIKTTQFWKVSLRKQIITCSYRIENAKAILKFTT